MLAVPVCLALENTRRLNDFGVIERAANKLDARRQAVLTKAARHADGGKPADITDAANGIGKRQCLVQVRVESTGGLRQQARRYICGGLRQRAEIICAVTEMAFNTRSQSAL